MTTRHQSELQQAISDIQLLGSFEQFERASEFARALAVDRRADSQPLLDDLRSSLRRELLLDDAPARRVVLRLRGGDNDSTGPSTSLTSAVLWHEQSERIARDLAGSSLGVAKGRSVNIFDSPEASAFVRGMSEHTDQASPLAALGAAHQRVEREREREREIRTMLEAAAISGSELLSERRPINEETRSAVEGLGVKHMLALLDEGGRRLDIAQADEYVAPVEGVLYALRNQRTN
jgi:hypothetical protein